MDHAEIIEGFFSADFKTGAITWRKDPPRWLFSTEGNYARHMRQRAGRPVVMYRGSDMGHLSLKIRHEKRNVTYLAHRIVWALAHREYPEGHLDHANNDPTDNRLANLRLASRGQNTTNGRRIKPGLKGAYQDAQGNWFSSVWDGKRLVPLGRFPDALSAHKAWLKAKSPIAGVFFNPGYPSVFD